MATVGGLDLDDLTPAQRRVVTELMAVEQVEERPLIDPDQHRRWWDFLHARLEPAVEARPPGARRITLGKTQLDALDCDGRYLDLLASRFEWSEPTVRGQLVHRLIALDQQLEGRAGVKELADRAWEEFRHSGDGALAYLDGLDPVTAAALRTDAEQALQEFREVWPLLPARWNVRFEPKLVASLHRGAIELVGKPDVVLGRTHPTHRRVLLVDLKTGRRNLKDRQDMRFYALLATFKYKAAPFRVATYYVDEGEWDHEDVTDEVLEAAARGVADKAAAALRLADEDGTDPDRLRLVAGPACRWCGRAPTCPERIRTDAERATA